jgi:hypothetical protein
MIHQRINFKNKSKVKRQKNKTKNKRAKVKKNTIYVIKACLKLKREIE